MTVILSTILTRDLSGIYTRKKVQLSHWITAKMTLELIGECVSS